ncbi:hypothetical protein Belba_3739 [Belliella baltica DSM 15883]|uniref:Uncharacterized protein n=1 Tax=Belliella baltica (strain DSM 15883 / CIP 108006 / LMG 21964 / BA134) TaxID=866536 RepID=I3ZAF7_BELBD|nr:hypothetical protein [Belliella baltica]AFL86225.1 hypothetical protein Belba_3739 [Belliella baltica DSM 15883]
MEMVSGGALDCSLEGGAAFVAGAGVAGAIFFGWGGLVSGYAAYAYWLTTCHPVEV